MEKHSAIPAYVNGPTGEIPVQLSPGEEPETITTSNETVGIDLPGVGVMRPGISPTCAGRENAAGEVPLGGDLARGVDSSSAHGRLLSQLIFAARDLAEEQIEFGDSATQAFCLECEVDVLKGVVIHERSCRAWRVLEAINQLLGLFIITQPKEAGADGETPGAGDGIRPHGLNARELASLLMFEHVAEAHHADLCKVCRLAFELGIKPAPIDVNGLDLDGLYADIQRKENVKGDGYFGAFGRQGGAR